MGLDIVVYKNLQKLEAVIGDDQVVRDPVTHEPLHGYFIPLSHPNFPGRTDDLVDGAPYSYSERSVFLSVNYGGYSNWREELAKLAGYPAIQVSGAPEPRHDVGAFNAHEGPFWELINFSDCEGTLGMAICKKLAADFSAFQEAADAHDDYGFIEQYDDWREATEMAANNHGAIDFC